MGTNKRVFVVWSCICMFYCFQYILRLLPNIMLPNLMLKFNITSADFGSFAGIYYVGYILFHVLIGVMILRFNGRLIMSASVLIATIGIIPLTYNDWGNVIIGRFLTGVGSSAAIIGAFHYLKIVSPQTFTRNLGALVCVGLVVAVYAMKPIGNYLLQMNLNLIIMILLIVGICLSLVCYVSLPEVESKNTRSISFHDIKEILLNYKLMLVAILSGMMVGSLEGFADAWGSSFMSSVYGITRVEANSIVSFILFGMCLGSLILPAIADRTAFFYGITLSSASVMLVCFLFLMSGLASVTSLYPLCLLIGIASAYQPVILSKITTLVPSELSSTAAALGNMIIMSFGFFFHNTIGITMNYLWNGEMKDGERFYNSLVYIKGISVIPFMLAIAAIGFIIVILRDRSLSRNKEDDEILPIGDSTVKNYS